MTTRLTRTLVALTLLPLAGCSISFGAHESPTDWNPDAPGGAPVTLRVDSEGPVGTYTLRYPGGMQESSPMEADTTYSASAYVQRGNSVSIDIHIDSPSKQQATCTIAPDVPVSGDSDDEDEPLPLVTRTGTNGDFTCTWKNE